MKATHGGKVLLQVIVANWIGTGGLQLTSFDLQITHWTLRPTIPNPDPDSGSICTSERHPRHFQGLRNKTFASTFSFCLSFCSLFSIG